jgi:hypothetical protein
MSDPGVHGSDPAGAPAWHRAWPSPPPQPPISTTIPVGTESRWRGTVVVVAIIGAVVLGGGIADGAIAAPSAGQVAVSGPVRVTAAPGWTVSTAAGDVQDGVALEHAGALLIVQVVSTGYSGDGAQLLGESERSLGAGAGHIWFGEGRAVELGGRNASEATFSALLSGTGGTGVLDGEVVCLVIPSGGQSYAVVLQVGVPQGTLGSVTSAVDMMAGSLEVRP